MMEERKLWIDRYEKLPTGNITDAMDALHMKRQVIFGLQPLAQGAKTTAGFAFTIQQRRRKTPWDGKNLARQGGLIDSKTQEGISWSLIWTDQKRLHRRFHSGPSGKNERSPGRIDQRLSP